MKEQDNIEQLRAKYTDLLHELAVAIMQRSEIILRDSRYPDLEPDAARQVRNLDLKIESAMNRMRPIEKRSHGKLGIRALFGAKDVPPVVRMAVAMLAMKGLCAAFAMECRSVSSLSEAVAAGKPRDMLTIREAFRKQGILRPFVMLITDRTVDEFADITLRESAFRSLLALEPDQECDEWIRARELLGTARR